MGIEPVKTMLAKLKDSWIKVTNVGAHRVNYDSRSPRPTTVIDMIVVHVSQSSMRSMDTYFATARPLSPTSAHFGVSKGGHIHVYVPVEYTAWHAGDSSINYRSIGIEHEGVGDQYEPTELQLKASAALASFLCRELGIDFDDIRPHREFRPTLCPAGFPMEKYRAMVEAATTGKAVAKRPDFRVVIHRNGEVVKILDVPRDYHVVQNLDVEGGKLDIDIRDGG